MCSIIRALDDASIFAVATVNWSKKRSKVWMRISAGWDSTMALKNLKNLERIVTHG